MVIYSLVTFSTCIYIQHTSRSKSRNMYVKQGRLIFCSHQKELHTITIC